MEHTVDLLHVGFITHDVKQFITTRPDDLDYEPGQGVELALDLDGWRDEGRPFTPTSLADEDVLEFTIKAYPEHDGVTERLHALEPGAKLHVSDSFGSITWQGPGTFIAAGAGITPFLAILRERARTGELEESVLHFTNSTPADIICERELEDLLQERCRFTCPRRAGRATTIGASTPSTSRRRSTTPPACSTSAVRRTSSRPRARRCWRWGRRTTGWSSRAEASPAVRGWDGSPARKSGCGGFRMAVGPLNATGASCVL